MARRQEKLKKLLDEKQPDETIEDILEKYDLSLEREMFCQYYTSATEFYGSGVQSYAAAFDHDLNDRRQYDVAKASACRLLKDERILRRINDLLEGGGLNDPFVDKQLSFLLTQNVDFKSKLGAIKEYNKLKQRIVDKIDHTGIAPVTTIELIPYENTVENENDNNESNTTPERAETESVQGTDEEDSVGSDK